MKFKDMEYEDAQKRLSQIYIVGEALELIGGTLALNEIIHSKFIVYTGLIIWIVGLLVFTCGLIIRCSKSYKKLKSDADNNESFADIKAEVGAGVTIFALIFIISIFIGAIYFAYYWTHSWYKVVLFLVAFSLVSDVKDYFAANDPEEVD